MGADGFWTGVVGGDGNVIGGVFVGMAVYGAEDGARFMNILRKVRRTQTNQIPSQEIPIPRFRSRVESVGWSPGPVFQNGIHGVSVRANHLVQPIR